MKGAKVAAVMAASGASAQVYNYPPAASSPTSSSSMMMSSSMMTSSMVTSMPAMSSPMPTSYTTLWEETCIDEPPTVVTVTNGYTVYHCPECENPRVGYTTVYETALNVLCHVCDGYLSHSTYTVTETCPGIHPTPVFSRTLTPTGYIPQGFTTTVTVCTVCGENDFTATLTVPCDKTASPSAVPMVPATATASPMPPPPAGGMPPAAGSSGMPPAGGSGGMPGSAPSPSSPSPMVPGAGTTPARIAMTTVSCTEAKCQATATGASDMGSCTDDHCQGSAGGAGAAPAPTGSYPTNFSWGNTSNITPYTGGAAALSLGIWSGFLAMVGVAAGAFLL